MHSEFKRTNKNVEFSTTIEAFYGSTEFIIQRVKCDAEKLQRAESLEKSYGLCLKLYSVTAKFPNEEKYGLTSQIRRSAVSIPSNIAGGYGRKTTLDYIRMLYVAYGSVCELETQVLLAGDLGFIERQAMDPIKTGIGDIERMLKALIRSLENKLSAP